MTGKVLQERLSVLTKMPYTEIAEMLGVSSQSMYQFFTAKDVKSGLIEKLCEVLDIDIATMYGQEPAQNFSNNQGDVITGDNVVNRMNEMGSQMISILDNQLRVKDEQIGKLLNILNK